MKSKYNGQPNAFQIPMPIPVQPPESYLLQPAGLTSFLQSQEGNCWTVNAESNVITSVYSGKKIDTEDDRVCSHCGATMNVKDSRVTELKHTPQGSWPTRLRIDRTRYACPCCQCSETPIIPFQSKHHRITVQLEQYIEFLLEFGLTLKDIARIASVDRHVVKDIDKRRLARKYLDENGELRKPEKTTAALGIDEFLLHEGGDFATVIVDLETGHVLWLTYGRTKKGVYDFIDFVGKEWMSHVKVVACDMNAGFEAAFREKCPHIVIVFDHFHVVQNLNKMVITEVRKDEQNRLKAEGDLEGAQRLKGSKWILVATEETRKRKDAEAEDGKVVRKASGLFGSPEKKRKGGRQAHYEEIVEKNLLLFLADYVKEALREAYTLENRDLMVVKIQEVIDICRDTENRHFEKFANLLENHFDGIVAHAEHPYSTGMVEGINQKIKTERRKAYGYRDDDYFFLKIMDASRRDKNQETAKMNIETWLDNESFVQSA